MRSEFEKLLEFDENLHDVVFNEGCNEYRPKKIGYVAYAFSAYFLNGAWYAFQEQQKKVDDLQDRIDLVLALIDTTSYSEINRRLPDFIDQLKDSLKGKEDE